MGSKCYSVLRNFVLTQFSDIWIEADVWIEESQTVWIETEYWTKNKQEKI